MMNKNIMNMKIMIIIMIKHLQTVMNVININKNYNICNNNYKQLKDNGY